MKIIKNKKADTPAVVEQEIVETCVYENQNNKTMTAEIDLDQKLVYVNKTFRDTLGYEKGELIGKGFEETLHPDMPMCLCDRAFSVALSGSEKHPAIWDGWIKSKNKDNTKCFWNHVHLTAIYKNGEITGYSVLKRNATEEKVKQIEEIYKEIKETGKSKNFCGKIE